MTESATTYDAWQAARLGVVTASRISDIIAKRKDDYPAASRANYLAELLLERLTGEPQDNSYQSEDMLRGIQLEPEALQLYEWAMDVPVAAGVFVPHPAIPKSGATPDGFVGADGLVEVKCPKSATHLATLEGASIKKEYMDQMMWQMACTGAQWCDFVSYDPRFPSSMSMYRERIERDDAYIERLEKEVVLFLRELDTKEQKLRERFDG